MYKKDPKHPYMTLYDTLLGLPAAIADKQEDKSNIFYVTMFHKVAHIENLRYNMRILMGRKYSTLTF